MEFKDYVPFDENLHRARIIEIQKRSRASYLRTKARKEAQIKTLALRVTDIPADVMAAIELDCMRYKESRIAAALRRVGEAKLSKK